MQLPAVSRRHLLSLSVLGGRFLPAPSTIKVVPTDEVTAAVERDAFVARWQAMVREQ